MLQLPGYIPLLMALCALFTLYALYRASGNRKNLLYLTGGWLALQGAVSLTGFYYADFSMPPRFALLIAPPLLLIAGLSFTEAGRRFLDALDLRTLTWLHAVRVPVELCLFWLYGQGQIPVDMTFEGRNFDILSGLTALPVAWIAFPAGKPRKRGLLLAWNVLCLLLLFNIVGTAIAASPYFAGQFGFETANRGVFYFPFVWLPCMIVPAVLLAHVAAIRQLLQKGQDALNPANAS